MTGFRKTAFKLKARLVNEWIFLKKKLHKFYRMLYSEQHQLTSVTSENRYPDLFECSKQATANFESDKIRILSFGCSTGEECFSLRQYFPLSHIIGADIDRANLEAANRKNKDKQIDFIFSNETNIKNTGPYQAIFCLSVLCRWEDTKDLTNCEKVYPFSRFDKTLKMLSGHLVKGGILVIYNSNFRFEDSGLFSDFEVVPTTHPDSGFVHKFDKDNNRVYETHSTCIYKKVR
ncbi:MAG: methyltransferase domain-containing protein [Cyclobacteriaceae bacterium]|nr:methyltransferase domain-containing protein [Cyclobacteriaceae bacterium]